MPDIKKSDFRKSPAEAKQEREKEARAQLFAQRGLQRPQSTDLATLLGSDIADEIEPLAPSVEDVEEPVKAKKPTPWANAHPKVVVPLLLRLPEDLHMKLTWLKEHLPNTSIQKLVRIAIEKEVESLIKKTYK